MMDYEKKYNEALNWMRELYPGLHGATKEDAEHYFPELRESEDERIRKALIDALKVSGTIGELKFRLPYPTREECIAYLEKKKEQKPAEKQDYSGLNDLERAIHRGFLCAGVENVPVGIIKETAQDCLAHLPAEWSEEDEKRVKEAIKRIDELEFLGIHCNNVRKVLESLRPSWKPSEEQMEALNKARRFIPYNCDILGSLYEQLKKL